MKEYSILKGDIGTDLDCAWDKDMQKIDVYGSAYWNGEDLDSYARQEKLIKDYKDETELYIIVCWCDISGFAYWAGRSEGNYVSIDCYLKKPVEEYTREEIVILRDAIDKADAYFLDKLELV